tara:strand:- start:208 stop:318 length:111 start_codon:yes stop_codon:yes gene_type:complete
MRYNKRTEKKKSNNSNQRTKRIKKINAKIGGINNDR